MPEIPFNYYAPVFAGYLLSPDALGDSDGASSYLHMIITHLKNQRSLIAPDTLDILNTAGVVSKQQTH